MRDRMVDVKELGLRRIEGRATKHMVGHQMAQVSAVSTIIRLMIICDLTQYYQLLSLFSCL